MSFIEMPGLVLVVQKHIGEPFGSLVRTRKLSHFEIFHKYNYDGKDFPKSNQGQFQNHNYHRYHALDYYVR